MAWSHASWNMGSLSARRWNAIELCKVRVERMCGLGRQLWMLAANVP